ncbi:MAG: FliI/YscN family ATPase [Nitrospirae bacterium]|nr:FliI/YscN family ATPase [Nitrospirota bacterium]
MKEINLTPYIDAVLEVDPYKVYGRILEVTGVLIKAAGLDVSIGESCKIFTGVEQSINAEVVGFKDGRVLLMALGELSGIKPGSKVLPLGRQATLKISSSIVGRILDDQGNPIDDLGPLAGKDYSVMSIAPKPLKKKRIKDPIDLGVRAINGLLTCGKGQRIGILSGTGVGKSVLFGMMAKYTMADINVIGLIGERGREVREFIERDLGPEGLKRSVVVVSTSEQPSVSKIRSAFTATTIAEYFRAKGKDVLLFIDSLTRVAMAQREIGLAIGEPPTAKGYTPSVFALLPKLLERAGTSETEGSITGIYTILVEGDDLSDPVADSAMSILDGHIVLSRDLAIENHYPAIDVLRSVSRVRPDIIKTDHMKFSNHFIETFAIYKRFEDMVNLGAYKAGTNPKLDYSLNMVDKLNAYLMQGMNEKSSFADSVKELIGIFNVHPEAAK